MADSPNYLDDARKRMEAKGTIGYDKTAMKKQSMVKPINSSAAPLASPLQKSSQYKFTKSSSMAKGKR
jgi:hypothetical protein